MARVGNTLIFSFDGTGNEPADAEGFRQDESISNILKLHLLLGGGIDPRPPDAAPAGEGQRAFYYNGIGTRQDGGAVPLLGRLYSAGRRVVNLALAPTFSDAQQILEEAAADLAAVYEPGDRIVLFGFSRGAALARKFATLLLDADERRSVDFLGVFDTVASMGGLRGGEVTMEAGGLHARVRRAVHAVAIDEDREAFAPTLIQIEPADRERVTEIWFPGVHSDVGGGYWNDGLSDVVLEYMIGRCRTALGAALVVGDGASVDRLRGEGGTEIAVDDLSLEPRFDAPLHADGGSALFPRDTRQVRVRTKEDADAGLPVLHYATKLRIDGVADYRPPALRDLRFRLWLDARRSSPPIEGISGLRRYRFPWWWRARRRGGVP